MKLAKKILLVLVVLLASWRAMREAYFHSTDLHVYWRSAHLWLSGISPYIYDSSDGGNVYKYPPWTIPIFLPLGWIGFDLTKWLWVVGELFCIGYSARWVIRAGGRPPVVLVVGALFWWTWLGHIFAGQFSIFMMAAALWAVPPEEEVKSSPGKLALLTVIFSAKVYSSFTLLGLARAYLKKKNFLVCLGLIVFLEAVVFAVFRFNANTVGFLELHRSWIVAAQSGAAELHADVIRGAGNHSFTALILREFRVDALDSNKDALVALGLGTFFSAIWWYFSRGCSRAEKWAGWIGVGMVIHPLLWHHSIVMAFPLCALGFDRAISSRSKLLIGLSSLSILLVALLIPNIFGPDFVQPFELLGSKSWGIFLAGLTLVLKTRRVGKITQ